MRLTDFAILLGQVRVRRLQLVHFSVLINMACGSDKTLSRYLANDSILMWSYAFPKILSAE